MQRGAHGHTVRKGKTCPERQAGETPEKQEPMNHEMITFDWKAALIMQQQQKQRGMERSLRMIMQAKEVNWRGLE